MLLLTDPIDEFLDPALRQVQGQGAQAGRPRRTRRTGQGEAGRRARQFKALFAALKVRAAGGERRAAVEAAEGKRLVPGRRRRAMTAHMERLMHDESGGE